MNTSGRRHKRFFLYFKTFGFVIIFSLVIFLLIYLNFYFKTKKINIVFFDNNNENIEIKKFTDNLLRKKTSNLYNYIFLDGEEMSKLIHQEFEIVSNIVISKNINMDLNVSVTKNQEFFYTCVNDDFNFLAKCMWGNTDGEYYKSMDENDVKKLSIEINKNVLYDEKTSKRIENPDSLSGTRIYTLEDFKVLREILKWVEKNGFQIEKVFVDELKIVEIYTDMYMVKISLDKAFVNTVKDFELISKTGDLQKYINEDKEKIQYIDLSYKDKVFYKLKSNKTNEANENFENATKTVIMSTTSTTTTN